MQTLFPEIWSDDFERADELRRISVEVLSDWAEYAPLLKYLRAAEIHTLADVALLRPEDIALWHGIGPSRLAMFVRLLQHVTGRAGDFISRNPADTSSEAVAIRNLAEVSLAMLLDRSQMQMLCRPLLDAGVSTLADFLALGRSRLARIKDIGKSRRVRMEAFRVDVIVHHEDYYRRWTEFKRQHAYPVSRHGDDTVLTLARLDEEMAALIADFEPFDQKLGKALRLYYKEKKPLQVVAKSCHLSPRQLRSMLDDRFVRPLLHGQHICGFTLRPVFLRQVGDLRTSLLYRPLPQRVKSLSPLAQDFMRLQMCDIGKQYPPIVISAAETRIAQDTMRMFFAYLGTFAEAQPLDNLMRDLAAMALRRRCAFSATIAEALVCHYPWVERVQPQQDGALGYRMSASHLSQPQARLHRILLDAGRFVTQDEILKRYVSLYGPQDETQMQQIVAILRTLTRRVTGIEVQSHGREKLFGVARDVYLGRDDMQRQPVLPLPDILPALIERLGYEFTLQDLQAELLRFGYKHTSQHTLHTLLTRHCCTDMDYIHHYCHKSHLNQHPQVRWRPVRTRSVATMIRDHVRTILRNRPTHTMSLAEMIDEVTAYTRLQGCPVRDVKSRLFAFTAPNLMVAEQQGKPFYFDTHELSIDICLK